MWLCLLGYAPCTWWHRGSFKAGNTWRAIATCFAGIDEVIVAHDSRGAHAHCHDTIVTQTPCLADMRSLSVAARPMACAANSTPLLVLILPAASRRLCTAHAASVAALCVLFRNPAVNGARRVLRTEINKRSYNDRWFSCGAWSVLIGKRKPLIVFCTWTFESFDMRF